MEDLLRIELRIQELKKARHLHLKILRKKPPKSWLYAQWCETREKFKKEQTDDLRRVGTELLELGKKLYKIDFKEVIGTAPYYYIPEKSIDNNN